MVDAEASKVVNHLLWAYPTSLLLGERFGDEHIDKLTLDEVDGNSF